MKHTVYQWGIKFLSRMQQDRYRKRPMEDKIEAVLLPVDANARYKT